MTGLQLEHRSVSELDLSKIQGHRVMGGIRVGGGQLR